MSKVKPRDFYTPGELAKIFGVTPKTVSNWCDKGLLPYITAPSGHRRIRASAVKGGAEGLARWQAMELRLARKVEAADDVPEADLAAQVLTGRYELD